MAADQLSKYIIISIIIHAVFLVSMKSVYINRDISQIGEQGMQIQMVLIHDKVNDVQEDESILSEEDKILKDT